MLSKTQARSVQFQLALKRINHRRTTELGSVERSWPDSETNRGFPVRSHVHAVSHIMDTAYGVRIGTRSDRGIDA
jgi:hypothetical protein